MLWSQATVHLQVVGWLVFVVLDVMVDAKPVCRDYEPHPCSCQPPTADEPGCADLCLNRSLSYLHYYWHCLSASIERQEERPACKRRVMRCWCGYLSGVRCKRSATDATATPSSLASLKSRLVWHFWCQLTQIVLEKRPLNRCLSVYYCYYC